jgi:hypothetical protein
MWVHAIVGILLIVTTAYPGIMSVNLSTYLHSCPYRDSIFRSSSALIIWSLGTGSVIVKHGHVACWPGSLAHAD